MTVDVLGCMKSSSASSQFIFDQNGKQYVCRLHEIKDFTGTLRSNRAGSTLVLGASADSGATVQMPPDTTLSLFEPTDVLSISTLKITRGAKLAFPFGTVSGTPTNGMLRVRDAVTVSGTGKIGIVFPVNDLAFNGVTNRHVILSAPKGKLSENDFELEFDFTDAAAADFPASSYISLKVENGESESRLVVTVLPIARLTASDNDSPNLNIRQSSINDPSHWSDGDRWTDGRPQPNVHYFVMGGSSSSKMCLNTVPGDHETFAGASLTIAANSKLTIFGLSTGNKASTNTKTFSASRLTLLDGCIVRLGQFAGPVTLDVDAIDVPSGTVNFEIYSGFLFTVDAPLLGSATIYSRGPTWTTGSPHGEIRFAGDNSGFTGRFSVNQQLAASPDDDKWYQTLFVGSADELGGDRDAMLFNGVSLTRMALLDAVDDITLPASRNLGIFVDGFQYGGRIAVAEGKTFDVRTQLTMNGSLCKEGAGALVLGGGIRFGSDGEAETPDASDTNRVSVLEGRLVVADSGSVNGLKLSFASGTSFAVKIDPDNADLSRWGARLDKMDVPISTEEASGTLSVSVDACGVQLPPTGLELGVITVKDSDAAAVGAILPTNIRIEGWPSWRGVRKIVHDDEHSLTTFAYFVFKPGMVIAIL